MRRCNMDGKIHVTAKRILLFGLRYFGGEISRLPANLPLTASGKILKRL